MKADSANERYFNDCLNRYTMVQNDQGVDTCQERAWLLAQVPTLLEHYKIDLRGLFPEVDWN